NLAFEPPAIIEGGELGLDGKAMNLAARAYELRGATLADMSPGEQLFYGRCTLCHAAREPGDLTFNQWRGITESMLPRAGLTTEEQETVLEFLAENAKDAVS